MNELDKKNIQFYLDQLEKIAGTLSDAESNAENLCDEVGNREYPSAFKYGCMIAITRICSDMVKNNIKEITNLINNL